MTKERELPEHDPERLMFKIDKVNEHRHRFCAINMPLLGSFRPEYAFFYNTIKGELLRQLPKKYINYEQKKVIRFCGETVRQKMHAMLALSRFVIAHDSAPSGEIIELGYCKNVGAITAILRKKGELSTSMTSDFHIHSKDFAIFEYECEDMAEHLTGRTEKEKTQGEIRGKIAEIIQWAEGRREERERAFSPGFREEKVWELPPLLKRN